MPDTTTSNTPIDVLYVEIRADTEGLKRQIRDALRDTKMELSTGLGPVVRDLETDLGKVADKITAIGDRSRSMSATMSSIHAAAGSSVQGGQQQYSGGGYQSQVSPTGTLNDNQAIIRKLEELRTHLAQAFPAQMSHNAPARDDVTVGVTKLTDELKKITTQFADATKTFTTLTEKASSAGSNSGSDKTIATLANKLDDLAKSLEKSISNAKTTAGTTAGAAAETLKPVKMEVHMVECPYCGVTTNLNAMAQKQQLGMTCPSCGASLKDAQSKKVTMDVMPNVSKSGGSPGGGVAGIGELVTLLKEMQQKSAVNIQGEGGGVGAGVTALVKAAEDLTGTVTKLGTVLASLGAAVLSMQTANSALQGTVQQSASSTLQTLSAVGANVAEIARLVPASMMPYKTAGEAGAERGKASETAAKATEATVDQSKQVQNARLKEALSDASTPAWLKDTTVMAKGAAAEAASAKEARAAEQQAAESRIRASLPWNQGNRPAEGEEGPRVTQEGAGLSGTLSKVAAGVGKTGEDVIVKLGVLGESAVAKGKEVAAGAVAWAKDFYEKSGGTPLALIETLNRYVEIFNKIAEGVKGASGGGEEEAQTKEQAPQGQKELAESQKALAEATRTNADTTRSAADVQRDATRATQEEVAATKEEVQARKNAESGGGESPSGGGSRLRAGSRGEDGGQPSGIMATLGRLLGGARGVGGAVGDVGGLAGTVANTAATVAHAAQATGGDVLATAGAGAKALGGGLAEVAAAGGALSAVLTPLLGVIGALGAAFAAWKGIMEPTIEFFKGLSTAGQNLAAFVDTAKTALEVTAKNSGQSLDTVREKLQSLQSTGIRTKDAMGTLSQFMSSGLPIDNIDKLARSGQNLAVAFGKDSTETFNRFTWAIQTQSTEMLRGMGITESASSMIEKYAQQHNKSAEALTQVERRQAMVNGIMKDTIQYAGLYDKAMDSLNKKMQSMGRYQEEATLAFGQALLPLKESDVNKQEQFWKALQKQFVETTKVWDEQSKLWKSVPILDENGNQKLTNLGEQIKSIAGMAKDAVQPWIDNLGKWMDIAGKTVGAALTMFNTLVAGTKQVAEQFLSLIGVSDKTFGALGKLLSPEGWKVLGPIVDEVMKILQKGVGSLIQFLDAGAVKAAELINWWKKVFAAIEPTITVLSPLYKAIKDMFDPKNSDAFKKNFESIGNIAQGVLSLFQTVLQIVTDISKQFVEGVAAIADWVVKGAAFVLNMVPAVQVVQTIVKVLIDNMPAISNAFKVVADWIGIAYNVLKNVNTAISSVAKAVEDVLGKTVMAVFTFMQKTIESVTAGPLGKLSEMVTSIAESFTKFADDKTNGFFSQLISLFTNFGKTLQDAGTALQQLFAIAMGGLAGLGEHINILAEKIGKLGAIDLGKFFTDENYRNSLMESLKFTDEDWKRVTDKFNSGVLSVVQAGQKTIDSTPPLTVTLKPVLSEDEAKKQLTDLITRATTGLSELGTASLKPSQRIEMTSQYESTYKPDTKLTDEQNAASKAQWDAAEQVKWDTKAKEERAKADQYVKDQLQKFAGKQAFSQTLTAPEQQVFNAKEYQYQNLSTDQATNDQLNKIRMDEFNKQKAALEKKFQDFFDAQTKAGKTFNTSGLYEDIDQKQAGAIQSALLTTFQGTEQGSAIVGKMAKTGTVSAAEIQKAIMDSSEWKAFVKNTNDKLQLGAGGQITGGQIIKQDVFQQMTTELVPGHDEDQSQYIAQQTQFVRELSKQVKDMYKQHDRELRDMQDNFNKNELRSKEDFNRSMLDADEDYQRQKTKSLRDFNIQTQRMNEDRIRHLADAEQDANHQHELDTAEFQKQQLKAQQDFQLQMQRMNDDYYMSLEDAVQQRDGTAVLRLERQHAIEQKRAQDDFNRQQSFDTKNFNDQWDKQVKERKYREQLEWERQQRDRDIQYQRQLEDMDKAHKDQEEQAQLSYDRQRRNAQTALDRQKEDLDLSMEKRKNDMIKDWAEIEGLSADSVKRILEGIDSFFGSHDMAGKFTLYANAALTQQSFKATINFEVGGITGPTTGSSGSNGTYGQTLPPSNPNSGSTGGTGTTPPQQPPQTPATSPQTGHTTGNMTVRQSPDTSSTPVDYLSANKDATVYGKSADGSRYAVHGDQNRPGWASTSYWSGIDPSKLPTLDASASFAEGGMMIADRPTNVKFGEAGKEAAMFLPLNKQLGLDSLSSLINGDGGGKTDRSDVNLKIAISTDGSLTPEFEDKLMGRLAEVIVAQVPKGVKVSQTK